MNGPALLRSIKISVTAAILGALLATGMALPAQAAETHSLTVTVRNVTGTPLVGMSIQAVSVAGGQQIQGDEKADGTLQKAVAVAGKPGVYTFATLGDFNHTLYFATPTTTTFTQLLGGASDIERAQVIPAGQSTLSVSLATNAVITGVVTTPARKAIPKALVTAFYYSGSEWMRYSSTRADAKGRYYLRDLDPGSYRLRFDGATGNLSPLFSGGSATFDGASGINVGVGVTTTVNAAFPVKVGAITGTSRVYYAGYEDYGYVGLKNAHAVAIPVTVSAEYPYKRTLDLDRSVSSGFADKKGKWTIAGLLPGSYAIKIYPWYYNQQAFFIGGYLDNATVYTVVANKTITASTTYTYQTDQGASLVLNVAAQGNSLAGANVLLQSDSDPGYYYRGTTDYIGNVTLGRSGANHVIQTGSYTLTVTTATGSHIPFTKSITLNDRTNYEYVTLGKAPLLAGFVAAPSIAQTELAVGARYVVAVAPKRTTAAVSYQWLRDGRPIYGADEAAYTSRAGDIGTQLTVRVSSYQFGYPVDTAIASVTGVVVSGGSTPTVVTPPSITPATDAHVGTTLRVLPGSWSVPGLAYSYEWFRDGVPFVNDGPSYVVTEGDLDSDFTATVSASKPGHGDATASTPNAVTPVFADSTELRSGLTITSAVLKTPKGAKKYTVKPGIWTALAPTFSYEWLRGGVVVGTGATLIEKPVKALLAQTLEVRVTAAAPGFGNGVVVRTARKATVALVASQLPTVRTAADTAVAAGTSVVVGQALVASTGTWIRGTEDVGALSYSYQWLRKVGTAKVAVIVGATAAAYTPKATDIGAVLTVRVTAASARFGSAASTIAAGTVIGTSELLGTVTSLALDGKAIPLQFIEAPAVPVWTAAGAKVSYQWYGCALPTCTATTPVAKFTRIAKATTQQWVVPKTYAKGRVFVAVTATKAGARSVRVDTAPVVVSAVNQIVSVRDPEIDTRFSVAIGSNVYGEYGNFSIEATQTREWQVCLTDCLADTAVWVEASGVADTYGFTPNGSNWGTGDSYLRIAEMATRTGYLPATSYSVPVALELGTLYDYPRQINDSGDTYTLSTQGTYPAHVSLAAQWYVGDELRSTTNSYTRTGADDGKKFFVVQTLSAVGYHDREFVRELGSQPETTITKYPTQIVGNTFGEELTLSMPVPWDLPQTPHANWEVTYTWHVAKHWGYESSFTPGPEDVGEELTLRVQARSPLYDAPDVYVLPVTILAAAAPALETPTALTWSGELLPGTRVTASTPTYAIADVDSAYQWQSSADDGDTWQNVAGATSADYTAALIDSRRMLRLVVTASKPGHSSGVIPSDPVQVLEGNVIRQLGAPVLSGIARVGGTLTTTTGAWSEGAVPGIQWLLNGRVIPGAIAATYVPLAIHAGDEISARVTGRQAGKLDVSAETAALTIATGAAPVATKAPVITSVVKLGVTTLTATPGVWNTSGLTYSFEWMREGVEPVTGETLALPAGSTRADYTLTVRATRFGYETGSVTAR